MNKKKVIFFIISWVLIFCYVQFFSYMGRDEIWNYGFSYNIASGLVPYRDFNMVILPLFNYIGSIFIIIFGNYLYSVNIFISLVLTLILFFMYYKIGKKVFVIIPLTLLYLFYSYNIFCVLLMVLIINFIDSDYKSKDIIISLLVSFMFLTKQNIGLCLVIPLIYFSKNKLKSIIVFLVPIFIFIMYLVYNDAFYDFIDYCFLGLFDFGNKNSCFAFLPLELPLCLFLVYRLIKSSFKDELCFYTLMFQIVSYPLMDDYHFMIGFIIFLYYIFIKYKINNRYNKYFIVMSCFYMIFSMFIPNNSIFNESFKGIYYSNSFLSGRVVSGISQRDLDEVSNYILDKDSEYDDIYIFSEYAYILKLYSNLSINKFDLINNGNMGYNGSKRYIEEVSSNCYDHSCLFILGSVNENQTNDDVLEYVRNNYNRVDRLLNHFTVYSNR